MPAPTPIVLNLYDPETGEVVRTLTRAFVPWKMLKMGIRLYKPLGGKPASDYTEEDIDGLTRYIMSVFPKDALTVEVLDEQSDVSEMFAVVKSVVMRARGVMDPTLPPKA